MSTLHKVGERSEAGIESDGSHGANSIHWTAKAGGRVTTGHVEPDGA